MGTLRPSLSLYPIFPEHSWSKVQDLFDNGITVEDLGAGFSNGELHPLMWVEEGLSLLTVRIMKRTMVEN